MMDDSSNTANVEPELITIVEGPEPQFGAHDDTWALSLLEGPRHVGLEHCPLRTFNGPAMVERCRDAWEQGRPVLLDFPNRLGLRRRLPVAAARYEAIPEGMVLHLWVRERGSAEAAGE